MVVVWWLVVWWLWLAECWLWMVVGWLDGWFDGGWLRCVSICVLVCLSLAVDRSRSVKLCCSSPPPLPQWRLCALCARTFWATAPRTRSHRTAARRYRYVAVRRSTGRINTRPWDRCLLARVPRRVVCVNNPYWEKQPILGALRGNK